MIWGRDIRALPFLFAHADYDAQDERSERFSDAAGPNSTQRIKRVKDDASGL